MSISTARSVATKHCSPAPRRRTILDETHVTGGRMVIPAPRAELEEAHDAFLSTGEADRRVRPLVAESWRRSMSDGLDPEHGLAPLDLDRDVLESWRAQHPLAVAMPVIRRLLVEEAVDSGLLVAVSDAAGRLLWVEGPAPLRRRMEGIHFAEGATWSETRAGTNAPGTALALDRPVQIHAAEHLLRPVTPWSCAAAPIHDPDTGAVLGALDLTGGDDVAGPHALSVVRATVAAVERELQLHRLQHTSDLRPHAAQPVLLRALGLPAGALAGEHGLSRLSLRHTELLLLLTTHREGITGDELAIALSDDDLAPVTLRAELSRLRGALGAMGLSLDARPYRIDPRVRTEVDAVRARLAVADVGGAVDLYRGDLLPTSDAPGIRRLRARLRDELRTQLLRARDPDALLRFADTEHGRHDWEIWRAAYDVLSPASPRLDRVRSHLAGLERDLR
ncbi:GAF domain-containing protein [Nocardioides sp. Kera G14]|uniref:GAF domain-containing protein n=1 Tax=Nocardioides sp. Kera G14 TaxID=2884264 RepID=UPI001D12F65E|nr:GAF domain-containing protein [Nocardioides sp. Kera G14]UDY24404.1 GAF domain-containing protein [Nocardioides sp. Kera G14]